MKTSVSYYSSIGSCENNEDSVKIVNTPNGLLAIIADGLGGMSNGKLASELAVNEFISSLDINNFAENEMMQAMFRANAAVRAKQSGGVKMCTTFAALWISDDKAISCYVGDSRIYQIRDNKVKYQSVDHSVSQLAVILGEITLNEIRGHKDRNKLIRSIGAGDIVKPQIDMLRIKARDAFLVCSDGFWDKIIEQDIVRFRGACVESSEWLSIMKEHIENCADDNNSAIAIIVK